MMNEEMKNIEMVEVVEEDFTPSDISDYLEEDFRVEVDEGDIETAFDGVAKVVGGVIMLGAGAVAGIAAFANKDKIKETVKTVNEKRLEKKIRKLEKKGFKVTKIDDKPIDVEFKVVDEKEKTEEK